jgi:hypothetical protein
MMTLKAASRCLVLLVAIIPIATAAYSFNQAWNWWRNGEKVLATVTWASGDDESGRTFAEVDFDGARATVELKGVHKVGDVVEVLFDPTHRDKLSSNSDVVDLLVGGLILLALGVGIVICAVVYGRSQSQLLHQTVEK